MLAKDMNGVAPIFNNRGVIRLRLARHPLLNKNTVVPINLTLGDTYDLLLVTGPNTGGKTVSLKTCGLLALMGQAGLHIPAGDRSELCIFDEIFADIGDEQSIEQSLSTFSSHMTNIIRTLSYIDRHPEKHFLVLFDELCAGTDPGEGAALATAILNRLHNLGIRTMATTHYSELKIYALSTPGVENACCEFSLETLSPTYHLLIGVPGKSNAFAISGKLGLPRDLIEDARQRLDEEDQSFEDVLIDLEQRRIAMERDARQISQDKQDIILLKERLSSQEEKLNASRDKILQNANEEASRILREAKTMADDTIRDFRKYTQSHPDMAKMEEKRQRLGKEIDKRQKKASVVSVEPPKNHPIPKNLRIGDSVKILSMNMKGTVYSLPNAKGDLQVQVGIMRSKVNIKDLMLLSDDDTAAKASSGKKKSASSIGSYSGLGKTATISPEINLLGLTGDEAIAKLDKYLDDAYISHLKSVRVVHGKGTGALRKAVHQYLRRQKIVSEFHLAEFGEGDAGVTIVTFR
jgi:DNA mismatch repair protein MutS2